MVLPVKLADEAQKVADNIRSWKSASPDAQKELLENLKEAIRLLQRHMMASLTSGGAFAALAWAPVDVVPAVMSLPVPISRSAGLLLLGSVVLCDGIACRADPGEGGTDSVIAQAVNRTLLDKSGAYVSIDPHHEDSWAASGSLPSATCVRNCRDDEDLREGTACSVAFVLAVDAVLLAFPDCLQSASCVGWRASRLSWRLTPMKRSHAMTGG